MEEGRQLDDNGASDVLFATQIANGEDNNVRIREYCEMGGVEWQQEGVIPKGERL